jgi:hypothetical protein
MGGRNSDIDRRHSIAIACPFVSRSNPANMKSEKAGYKINGTVLIASSSAAGFRVSHALIQAVY